MNEERIASMKEQLVPSPQARGALEEKLIGLPKKRPIPYRRYIALAACAALVIAAWPVYRMIRPAKDPSPKLHSYTLVQTVTGTDTDTARPEWNMVGEDLRPAAAPIPAPDPDTGTTVGTPSGEGDRDMLMTPAELEEQLLQNGVSPQELEGKELYCTWSLWWSFVHQDGTVTLSGLEAFLDQEDNRAWVEEIRAWEAQHPDWTCDRDLVVEPEDPLDIPAIPEPVLVDQQAALAQYFALFDHFEAEYGLGKYPEWYGGAWLDNSFDDMVSRLTVAVVRGYDTKELLLQIQAWAGGDELMFTDCKYSLSFLRDLEDQVCREMGRLGLLAECGVDEELNFLELTLTDVTDEALIWLAKLDPEDDAIRVRVGAAPTVDLAETPVSYDASTGKVIVGPPIPTQEEGAPIPTQEVGPPVPIRDGSGDVSTPPYSPAQPPTILRPGDPGYIDPGDPPPFND